MSNVNTGPVRRLVLAMLVLMGIGTIPACNTVEGAGEDIEEAGDAIEDAADEVG